MYPTNTFVLCCIYMFMYVVCIFLESLASSLHERDFAIYSASCYSPHGRLAAKQLNAVMYTGDNIRSLWSMAFRDFSTWSLMMFVPVYFVFAAWTSGLAIPSGSFSPAIFLGSCIGRLSAHFLQHTAIVEKPDAGLYALLGAAGFFTGAGFRNWRFTLLPVYVRIFQPGPCRSDFSTHRAFLEVA